MFNVVNPDMIVEKFGADTLRLYEMFLGPVEQSKPWDTNGIDGCHRFLKKLWKFMTNEDGTINATDGAASKEELKALHTLIKKVTADIEVFSYNTCSLTIHLSPPSWCASTNSPSSRAPAVR